MEYTIKATIHHGDYYAELVETGKTTADALRKMGEKNSYIAHTEYQLGYVLGQLDTNPEGTAQMGWVNYESVEGA